MWWLIALAAGCGGAVAPVGTELAERPPGLAPVTLAWDRGVSAAFDGQAVRVVAHVYGFTPGASVALVAANGAAAAPWCLPRWWVCLDGARPLIPAGQQPLLTPGQDLVFSVNAGDLGLAAGDELVLQAVLLDPGGRPWSASPPLRSVVEPTVVGCTYPPSPDYDPTATLDGGCVCPARIEATTAAELAPYAGCVEAQTVDLTGFVDAVAELPAMERLTDLRMNPAPGIEVLRMPSWEGPPDARLYVARAPALRDVEVPRLVGAEVAVAEAPSLDQLRLDDLAFAEIDLATTGLRTLSLPSAERVSVEMVDNPGFDSLDAPLLRESIFGLSFVRSGPVGALRLPSLVAVSDLVVRQASGLTAFEAPALETLGYLDVRVVPDLSAWSTPSLRELREGYLTGAPSLTSMSLPALTKLEAFTMIETALRTFSTPALGDSDWEFRFIDNPALCVTDEPIFASPPAGCFVDGRGNLCDP
jgi:hypothetical protein